MKLIYKWNNSNNFELSKLNKIPNIEALSFSLSKLVLRKTLTDEVVANILDSFETSDYKVEVIENFPIPEEVKLGLEGCDEYIENLCTDIKKLSKIGVKCIRYNFMPLYDYLKAKLPYESLNEILMDKDHFDIDYIKNTTFNIDKEDKVKERIDEYINGYKSLTNDQLFNNLIHFLKLALPVADAARVTLAICPDHPFLAKFNAPRTVSTEKDLDKLFKTLKSKANGLSFNTRYFVTRKHQDILRLVEKYTKDKRVKYLNLDNIFMDNGKLVFKNPSNYDTGIQSVTELIDILVYSNFDGYISSEVRADLKNELEIKTTALHESIISYSYLSGIIDAYKSVYKK